MYKSEHAGAELMEQNANQITANRSCYTCGPHRFKDNIAYCLFSCYSGLHGGDDQHNHSDGVSDPSCFMICCSGMAENAGQHVVPLMLFVCSEPVRLKKRMFKVSSSASWHHEAEISLIYFVLKCIKYVFSGWPLQVASRPITAGDRQKMFAGTQQRRWDLLNYCSIMMNKKIFSKGEIWWMFFAVAVLFGFLPADGSIVQEAASPLTSQCYGPGWLTWNIYPKALTQWMYNNL